MTFPGPVRHVGGDRDGDKNPLKAEKGHGDPPHSPFPWAVSAPCLSSGHSRMAYSTEPG